MALAGTGSRRGASRAPSPLVGEGGSRGEPGEGNEAGTQLVPSIQSSPVSGEGAHDVLTPEPSAVSSEPIAGETLLLVVPEAEDGQRLDAFLARQLPSYSRTHLRRAINAVGVKLDGRRVKASHHLRTGQQVSIVVPEVPRLGPLPEDIPLDVLYEDEVMAVINKPAGMVVHPGRGHWDGTLASALRHYFEQLSQTAGPTRPGIVHRLDRDTSGAILIAKDDIAHSLLSDQFEQRTVDKTYFAIVAGEPDRDRDWIDLPIGVHPYQREKMAVRHDHATSRPAQTFYEVVERLHGFAAVRLTPKTGRTHQIRVHLASIGCPVLCDRYYGGRASLRVCDVLPGSTDESPLLERQALHAQSIAIDHPTRGNRLTFNAPLPADLEATLTVLRQRQGKPATKHQ
ncbi:MAG: RluA family pseudouridine synthase [Planctomycetes bacterium]|nr:RluA family pseudouridine synthase [Planctomycetota bacterium]